jgi:hypothetical protein
VFKNPPARIRTARTRVGAEPHRCEADPRPGFGSAGRGRLGRGTRRRSNSTWVPDEGGEGPTPYEVLHAAMMGQSVRFTRQDTVEEAWRISSRC